jgi:hypothetical protein
MLQIELFSEILDELAAELPEEFYSELNLGINISEEAKPHPLAKQNDLVIMGEYFHNQIGRGIIIYYGSFARVFSHLTTEELTNELRHTLRHEFRHHMEGRAGERGLEIEDERQLRGYLEQ